MNPSDVSETGTGNGTTGISAGRSDTNDLYGADRVVADLWTEYRATGALESRERLIIHYSPLVNYVAGQVARGLPSSIEFGDLVSYGVFGLLNAIGKYDPERGIKFETYAITRIKGAMFDELRAKDWVPRSVRDGARSINRAHESLRNELMRSPSDSEVAGKLGMSPAAYADLQRKIAMVSTIALDEPLSVGSGEPGDTTRADRIADVKVEDPAEAFEREDVQHLLTCAIDELTERHRIVVMLHYFEGLSLKEIAKVLSVSETRVSQMHMKAILRLRSKLSPALA